MNDRPPDRPARLGLDQCKTDNVLIVPDRAAVFADQPEPHPVIALAALVDLNIARMDGTRVRACVELALHSETKGADGDVFQIAECDGVAAGRIDIVRRSRRPP